MAELFKPEAFSSLQLAHIGNALDTTVREWAIDNSFPQEPQDQYAQGVAAAVAYVKLIEGQSRLSANPRENPLFTPAELAGRGAGKLAIARTIIGWYDLTPASLQDFPRGEEAFFLAVNCPESLERDVCTLPNFLRFSHVSTRDTFVETSQRVEHQVESGDTTELDLWQAFADEFLQQNPNPIEAQ